MGWLIFALIIGAIVWYALKGRAWLKAKPWAQGFFAWAEPIELALYKKSETILMGRLLSVGGLFVTAYDTLAASVQSLDMTPITTRVMDLLHVAQDMRGLVVSAFITAIGIAVEWLRKRTTKPLEQVAQKDPA
jgi:hypothetical protein